MNEKKKIIWAPKDSPVLRKELRYSWAHHRKKYPDFFWLVITTKAGVFNRVISYYPLFRAEKRPGQCIIIK